VCPTGASYKRKADGIVLVDYDKCIGCKYCAWACPYGARELDEERQVMTKCTLCVDRVHDQQLAPEDRKPACVKACPTGAIVFGTKDDMKEHAAERIVDLKSRGFDQAGLYDPAGVGGTHVMYVLHHADQPSLYSGLPDQPKISAMVGLWKGVSKPASLVIIALTALAGFFHYIGIGRNEVSESDEQAAERELEKRHE
jgi:formate dehydrogenase iron-sulfur subunit